MTVVESAFDTWEGLDEEQRVVRWRRLEAKRAGLSFIECRLYSESDIDAGELRRLVRLGYTPEQIAELLF